MVHVLHGVFKIEKQMYFQNFDIWDNDRTSYLTFKLFVNSIFMKCAQLHKDIILRPCETFVNTRPAIDTEYRVIIQ